MSRYRRSRKRKAFLKQILDGPAAGDLWDGIYTGGVFADRSRGAPAAEYFKRQDERSRYLSGMESDPCE